MYAQHTRTIQRKNLIVNQSKKYTNGIEIYRFFVFL